ncbi:MAG: c-type cytochrome [Dehalococcoidia bacterium]
MRNVGRVLFWVLMATALLLFYSNTSGATDAQSRVGASIVIPEMNPERGKRLFIEKGCVACHAINGVGGKDAPPMDAHHDMGAVNPFDFAVEMWEHAAGMIYAQEEVMGEQIMFTGQELADIIAFLHNEEAQHAFSEADLTPAARGQMHHNHSDGHHDGK